MAGRPRVPVFVKQCALIRGIQRHRVNHKENQVKTIQHERRRSGRSKPDHCRQCVQSVQSHWSRCGHARGNRSHLLQSLPHGSGSHPPRIHSFCLSPSLSKGTWLLYCRFRFASNPVNTCVRAWNEPKFFLFFFDRYTKPLKFKLLS